MEKQSFEGEISGSKQGLNFSKLTELPFKDMDV